MVRSARNRITTVALASDHAGYAYKEKTAKFLSALGISYRDYGTFTPDPVDYPDVAHSAAIAVSDGTCRFGIFICGTGIGMSIVANKHRDVRAAACESTTAAELSRLHNNANVLCFGERLTSWPKAKKMILLFLNTNPEGGRHARRVRKIHILTSR
ncbi:MAG: ribose 5-phosphate isomerase B [Ignavibacteriales bacterium]|nr:ribose 5-phosphate isomerase B [Ignavibacteriales bacterium]